MRKRKVGTILLCLVLLAGIGLLAYPSLSNYLNSLHQSHNLVSYADAVNHLDDRNFQEYWEYARAFNEVIRTHSTLAPLTASEQKMYMQALSVDDTGILGQISIPRIDVTLPLYHGTSDAVLQGAAGHLEGTTLPTGDAGCHSVLTGHSGLPSAQLFTDLEKMEVGDTFTLSILNRTFTYEVDQILTVLPDDTSALALDIDRDLCTLVTCTPYGINSHRLLVRGSRMPPEDTDTAHITPRAVIARDPKVTAGLLALGVMLVVIAVLLLRRGARE